MVFNLIYISIIISGLTSIGSSTDTIRNCIDRQEIEKFLIQSGEFKSYYQFDLGEYYFYNGIFENNLMYAIHQKDNNDKVYARKDSQLGEMILKPTFFSNSDKSTILIMVEVASEYSWGQEIVLIRNREINYLGFLNYAVDDVYGESISKYSSFECEEDTLIMIFKDIPIINWSDESNPISGESLRFEITNTEIKRIQ